MLRWSNDRYNKNTGALTDLTRSKEIGSLLPHITNELNKIEPPADHLRVPLAFARELYDLKVHIEFVRGRLR